MHLKYKTMFKTDFKNQMFIQCDNNHVSVLMVFSEDIK